MERGKKLGSKLIIMDGQSLLNLLTHYTDGAIDLDAKLINIGISEYIESWIGLTVESAHWKDEKLPNQDAYGPLHIRYEGKKMLTWGQKNTPYEWKDEGKGFEVPK